jgi:uncharacterized protein
VPLNRPCPTARAPPHSSPVAPVFADLLEQTRLAARALVEYGEGLVRPTVRLGITGLSRAGKTVFITALVHGLVRSGRFPVFEALSEGRIARARLSPQPDDAVPRFDYESHVAALVHDRVWPESTRQISELRLVIEYQSRSGSMRELVLDMVDYPGEWLLDLPLLGTSFEAWSAASLALSRQQPRARLAAPWHAHLATLDPSAPADENHAIAAARLFTDYLVACRTEHYALSLLPPGRFLMPGDLAGSPALTFAPLDLPGQGEAGTGTAPDGSLWGMMRRRYEAYKEAAVRPFFRDHFARLDRQIVLIDALAAFNAGLEAVHDLENTFKSLLDCFEIGRRTFLSSLFRPRADRILFAATKADHLHHLSHDRLEAILRRMVERAIARSHIAGAAVDVIALAAVRATREAEVRSGPNTLPCILGAPAAGEHAGGTTFDGTTEVAVFPGDLPADPDDLFAPGAAPFRGLAGAGASGAADTDFRFVRFRPPPLETAGDGAPALPHIRLDRALQFLIGDRLT